MMAICSRPALIGKYQKSIDCGAECEHQVQRFKDSKNWGRKSVGTTFLCPDSPLLADDCLSPPAAFSGVPVPVP